MSCFAENLKQLRLQHRLSQSELAERIYTSAQCVSRWENDESTPSIDMLCALCDVFSVTSDQLIRGDAVPEHVLSRQIAERASASDSFAELAMELCKSILCGRADRIGRGQIPLGNKPYGISVENSLVGMYSEAGGVFSLCTVSPLCPDTQVLERLSSVFAMLADRALLAALLNTQNAVGWYDRASAVRLLGIADEEFDRMLSLLEAFNAVEKRCIVNARGSRTVYRMAFSYQVRSFLSLAVLLCKEIRSVIW